MSDNMKIYEEARTVPKEALKEITGGRLKGMSDINPMWRIKKLTELFGMCGVGWKVEITDRRLERGDGVEIVCFVDINLYVKVDGEWSAPIPGMGGSSFVTMEKHGPYTSDECFKMAYTDAISVACKSLGFAADVYFGNDRTKYSERDGADDFRGQQQPRTASQQKGNTNTSNFPSSASQRQESSQGADSLAAVAARVYKMRESYGWSWPQLTQFAGEVLNREVKFLKKDVQTTEEWKMIEAEMVKLKDAYASASGM